MPGFKIGIVAAQVADHATGFGDQQAAGGDVPRFESGLEKSVIASRRHPRQVDRGGAGAAQAGGLLHQVFEDADVGIQMFESGIGKNGGGQAVGKGGGGGGAQGVVVEGG